MVGLPFLRLLRRSKAAPLGAHFSLEWGHTQPYTKGTRREFDADEIEKTIRQLAGSPNIERASQLAETAIETFDNDKSEVLSLLSTEILNAPDQYLDALSLHIS
jgi:hypothetical protein